MPSSIQFPDNAPEDLAGWCRYFGLPEDVHINTLIQHLMGNASLTIAAKDISIDILERQILRLRSALVAAGVNPTIVNLIVKGP